MRDKSYVFTEANFENELARTGALRSRRAVIILVAARSRLKHGGDILGTILASGRCVRRLLTGLS